MISDKVFNTTGTQRIFGSDFKIISGDHIRVFLDGIVISRDKYDLINNAAVFNVAPVLGQVLTLQVGTTPADIIESPTDAGIVAANIADITSVAGQIESLTAEDLTDPSSLINVGLADARYVNTTGDSMTGPLDMGSNRITNLAEPLANTDALRLVDGNTLFSSGTSSAIISETPPSPVVDGARWYKASEATTYVRYNDGDSSQWIEEHPNFSDTPDHVRPFASLAAAVANATLKDGQVLNLKERTTGNGGGAVWDVVLASSVTPNTFNIVQCIGNNTLALVLRIGAELDVIEWGVTGVGDDTSAAQHVINYATSNGINLRADINFSVTELTLAKFNSGSPQWLFKGNGVVTASSFINFRGLQHCTIEGLVFDAPVIYIQGFRYSTLRDVQLKGQIRWGRWDIGGTPGGASWSTYWSSFENVLFGSIHTQTSITDANFNSNLFTNCEFRDSEGQGSLWKMKNYGTRTNEVFVSNTFVSCDFSYAPVWWLETDFGQSFAINIQGGYLDTGTAWYHPSSFRGYSVNVIGLRNPSGLVLDSEYQADIQTTTGGARPRQQMPVSPLSIFDSHPLAVKGSGTTAITATIPMTGKYSISATVETVSGADGALWKYENLTTTVENFISFGGDGSYSFTFYAERGDNVRLLIDGNSATTDLILHSISLTAGAGVYGALPANIAKGYSEKSLVEALTTTPVVLFTLPTGQFKTDFRDVTILSKGPDTSGGGEMVKLVAAIVGGSSSAAITLTEVSRVLVNGVGGSGDNPAPMVVTTSTSGRDVIISVASSGTDINIDGRISSNIRLQ